MAVWMSPSGRIRSRPVLRYLVHVGGVCGRLFQFGVRRFQFGGFVLQVRAEAGVPVGDRRVDVEGGLGVIGVLPRI